MHRIAAELKAALAELGEVPVEGRAAIYNDVAEVMREFIDLPHPVLGVKLVPADQVRGNEYNPNKVAPPEMRLLATSIRRDGVTMPIVAAKDPGTGEHVVVDGFHRTTIIQQQVDVRESLGGFVPVVELDKSVESRMASTVRHNMARGTHQVELSAKLVTALTKHHWTPAKISEELGMDADEVLRLKQITGLAEAFRDREFSRSWG